MTAFNNPILFFCPLYAENRQMIDIDAEWFVVSDNEAAAVFLC
jgi:hypothetical protein